MLDHFSEEEINKQGIFYYPKSKRIAGVRLSKDNKQYDSTQFAFYPSSYKIVSVTGIIEFDNNINKCNEKRNSIKNEIEKIFSSIIPKEEKSIHAYDKSGKSIAYKTAFYLNDGSALHIVCYDWAKGVYSQNIELTDTLNVSLRTSDYRKFLTYEAY